MSNVNSRSPLATRCYPYSNRQRANAKYGDAQGIDARDFRESNIDPETTEEIHLDEAHAWQHLNDMNLTELGELGMLTSDMVLEFPDTARSHSALDLLEM